VNGELTDKRRDGVVEETQNKEAVSPSREEHQSAEQDWDTSRLLILQREVHRDDSEQSEDKLCLHDVSV
jgi:hypothetical protein